MDPLVVYIFDRPNGFQSTLEDELRKAGVDFLPDQINGFTWGKRVLRTAEIAEKYPDRVLFFLDAWDTLFLGEKWELELEQWKDGITFASQKSCWPDPVDREYNIFYEYKLSTRWRYLNSNPMAGLGVNIARAIRWGWEKFPLKGDASTTTDASEEVCERFYTRLLLRAPKEWNLRIDTQCILAQTVAEGGVGELAIVDGRVVNIVTNSRPTFFHINGSIAFDVGLLKK